MKHISIAEAHTYVLLESAPGVELDNDLRCAIHHRGENPFERIWGPIDKRDNGLKAVVEPNMPTTCEVRQGVEQELLGDEERCNAFGHGDLNLVLVRIFVC